MLSAIGLTPCVVFAIIFFVIVLAGVIGNLFVASVIVTDRKMFAGTINLFLLNLALADLGNLLACCPDIALFLIGNGWLLPGPFCPLLRFLEEYFLYASVLMQMSIGIERFMAICRPFRSLRMSTHTSVIMIPGVWAIAALFAAPYLIYQRIYKRSDLTLCFWSRELSRRFKLMFKMAEFLVLYVFPLILLTVVYTIMGYVLWGRVRSLDINEKQQATVLRVRRSVIKMLIVSMLLYFICYSPIQGIFAFQLILQRDVRIGPVLRLTLNALSFSSSSANPIVYIVCCRQFRTRFLRVVRVFCPRFYMISGLSALDKELGAIPTRSLACAVRSRNSANSSTNAALKQSPKFSVPV